MAAATKDSHIAHRVLDLTPRAVVTTRPVIEREVVDRADIDIEAALACLKLGPRCWKEARLRWLLVPSVEATKKDHGVTDQMLGQDALRHSMASRFDLSRAADLELVGNVDDVDMSSSSSGFSDSTITTNHTVKLSTQPISIEQRPREPAAFIGRQLQSRRASVRLKPNCHTCLV